MVYIKKLVMKGFKSFAKETELPFTNAMNVVVGPNGSGKSNITDAICFALGRLSVKSMRAAKTSNLIFAGTKIHKPCSEASVTLVFDNTERRIPIDKNELELQRIVRHNGQGIYKINGEVKTRQEVLEILNLAGIDPYGFNIVLQGEIQSIVKMTSEERRKVIEEVAGISIYEIRKEKSIKEMEKTEERLKEVQSILRERTSYLRNLEEERKQALKFKKLEETIKKCKASIINKKIDEKVKEIEELDKKQKEKDREKLILKDKIEKIQLKITEINSEVLIINQTIQRSSGVEHETLNSEISNLRANLAVLKVKKESNESKLQDLNSRKIKLNEETKKLEAEILALRKDFPTQAKKYQELEEKKKEFSTLEAERKALFNSREKLNALKTIYEDKSRQIIKAKNEVSFIHKDIEKISEGLSFMELEVCQKESHRLRQEIEVTIKSQEKKERELIEHEKQISLINQEIDNTEKIKKQVSSLDICPLCKSKITEEHLKNVYNECDEKIIPLKDKLKAIDMEATFNEIKKFKESVMLMRSNLAKAELDLIKLKNIEDKKEQIKKLVRDQNVLENDSANYEKEREALEKKLETFKDIEEKYDKVFLDIREISSRTQENLSAELEFKERDLERIRNSLKHSIEEEVILREDLSSVEKQKKENEHSLSQKLEEEKVLEVKYQKFLDKKSSLEKQIHEQNQFLYENKTKISLIENDLNNFKIEFARVNAEKETYEIEFSEFVGIELISASIKELEQRLHQSQIEVQTIGSVNLRALEVYDKMKQEYDEIAKKAETLDSEKLEILKIIEEIDKKKKKTYVKTLFSINELFNRNFTQLSTKGQVSLEVENEQDPFSAGLDIIVKVGKGKYFDVTSLSGGEQTLVALSLIFAIQEYKPYAFYIFDEVDAALDKRNSERLAALVKRYMKLGQYIIVTHNDALITESSVLYGVSMQDGISKILSLEI